MRRSAGLGLSRRHFCAIGAAGTLVACSDGVLPVQTGGLNGGGGGGDNPDAPEANNQGGFHTTIIYQCERSRETAWDNSHLG